MINGSNPGFGDTSPGFFIHFLAKNSGPKKTQVLPKTQPIFRKTQTKFSKTQISGIFYEIFTIFSCFSLVFGGFIVKTLVFEKKTQVKA